MPLLSVFGNPKISEKKRLMLGSGVCLFACLTTAALHMVCKPYVMRIVTTLPLGSGPVKFEGLTFYATKKTVTVNSLAEVTPSADKLFAKATTDAGDFLYLHTDESLYLDDAFATEIAKRCAP